jgi:DNA repair exonuclease SbcCD nuclease subunit
MVAAAHREKPDAVVVAGDLFDNARVEQSVVDWVAAELGALPCPVVVLPGNHDPAGPDSIYHRFDRGLSSRSIHVILKYEGEIVDVPETEFTMWGRAVVEHNPEFRPLVGVPPRPKGGWAVVLAHGLVMASDSATQRGSPIYPADMRGIAWDYVALGHVPRFGRVDTAPVPAFYAGDTANSLDGQPGGVIVTFGASSSVEVTWRGFGPLHPLGLLE